MRRFLMITSAICLITPTVFGFGPKKLTLKNGGFEDDLGYWNNSGDNGMSLAEADAAYRGVFGLRVVDEDIALGSTLLSKEIRVKPGGEYEVTFWARAIKRQGVAVYLRFRDKEGTLLNSNVLQNELLTVIPGAATSWKKYTVEGVAPANAKKAEIWVHSFVKAEATADIDEISIVEK